MRMPFGLGSEGLWWKNVPAGVCFCLKSNLPWLWLMSLRVEWQPAAERSTALPGLFVPRADGKDGGGGSHVLDSGTGCWLKNPDPNTLPPTAWLCQPTHTNTHTHRQLGGAAPQHTNMRVLVSLKCGVVHVMTILTVTFWYLRIFINVKCKSFINYTLSALIILNDLITL